MNNEFQIIDQYKGRLVVAMVVVDTNIDDHDKIKVVHAIADNGKPLVVTKELAAQFTAVFINEKEEEYNALLLEAEDKNNSVRCPIGYENW